MAPNDIYNSQRKYENILKYLDDLTIPPKERPRRDKRAKIGKYYVKNPENLQWFRKLITLFEAKDISYVRRIRLLACLKIICHHTPKALPNLDRDDVNGIVAQMHKSHKSVKSKQDFIRDIRHIWKSILPEKDERGREDETLIPYAVRHLSARVDKSREKRRDDRLSFDEFERLVSYFGKDPRMQFYLMLALESLGRPQEVLYTRIKDVDLQDNYARIHISSHGKEGTGILQVIDSYPYLIRWLKVHPLAKDPDAFLFVNLGCKNRGGQLTNVNINKHLRSACKCLGITKPITCYSLKRNGITHRRLRGDTDLEVQHAARWTSTKQLSTYDKSDQEDALRIALVKRGMLKDEKLSHLAPKVKTCTFCSHQNGYTEQACEKCLRPLDRQAIQAEFDRREKEMAMYQKMIELGQVQTQTLERVGNLNPEALQRLLKVLSALDGALKT